MNSLFITHEINRVKIRTDISEPNTPVISQYLAMNYPSLRSVFSENKYEKFSGEVNVEPISRN
jgi:hypothetical protein